ncbi:GDNF family receptor alpha-3 precursor [Danio rerio]|uniref:GDNF family receptor alpha 3 n=1 Tax=Danio rerio TaxID=7955 RepID=E7F4G1_DANRE|nr:GDNF family receptor alpha-3 precursor [Danio rerio]ADW27187.1 GDNF family receptor alpha 3 [Danio rerio]|eukprot:NP_001243565.1 GDNF family receptor alpha 3 precursor [Danio rerio]
MILLGILLNLFVIKGSVSSVVPVFPESVGCLEALQECMMEPECKRQFRHLEYCVDEEAVAPLNLDARQLCVDAQNTLMHYQPLQDCKCQRGSRMEQQCLSIYWTIRFPQGYDDIETSPYEDIELELVRNTETSKLASIVSVSSLPLTDQNQCLKAAQDCGLYEKCGSLRSEYASACTKILPNTNHCNRHKCHRALRRFLERVPEEYSFGVLFCPCSDTLCGERRRKTIVPSCSYEERDGQPNCLHLESYCLKDNLCRSRLADFQQNCQPSSLSPSGCLRDSGAVCLKAYAGLIGTIMTPNYVSNSSTEVSQWCNCEGSGNQWQDCLRILHMFNSNTCLRNAIDNMGSSTPRPVEGTPLPPPRPSPQVQRDELNINLLPEPNAVEESEEVEEEEQEEEEEEEEENQAGGGGFNVIPPFSDKATVTNLGSEAGRVQSSASTCGVPQVLLAVLLLITFRWV